MPKLKEIALDIVRFGRTHDEEATRFLKSNEQRLNENFRRLKEATEEIMADFTDVYRKSEVDTLLAGKANASHNHDSRYYTETEINSLVANGLLYKGYAKSVSTDFDDIVDAGVYLLDGTTMTNAPANYTWSYLLVLGADGSSFRVQMVINTPWSYAKIYARNRGGSPLAWGTWGSTHNNAYGDLLGTGATLSHTPSAVSVASSTWKTVSQLTLPVGRWVVFANARFNSNATGYRDLILSADADDGQQIAYIFHDTKNAVNGNHTYCSISSYQNVATQTTRYLNAYQNSGSALNVIGRMYAIRIC